MFQYIIKRILIFIPTFFAISLIIFGLSKMAPGDPVDVLLTGGTQAGNGGQRSDLLSGEEAYLRKAKELGLDKPVFYFSFTSAAYPKNIYKIAKQHHRELVSRLIGKYGNAAATQEYYTQIRSLELNVADLPETDSALYEPRRLIKQTVEELYIDYDDLGVLFKLDTIKSTLAALEHPALAPVKAGENALRKSYLALKAGATPYKLYIPNIHFYGFDNQYHAWMFGDYPWLQSVDSTDHRRINTLYSDIARLNNTQDSLSRISKTLQAQANQVRNSLVENDSTKALSATQVDSMTLAMQEMEEEYKGLESSIAPLLSKIDAMTKEKNEINKRLKIYASRGFLRGDFGTSYTNGRPVSIRMQEALYWTLIMNFFSIVISYIISIPLGVQSALWKRNESRYIPLLSTPMLIGTGLLVLCFYLYLSNFIGTMPYYLALLVINFGFLLYSLISKEDDSQRVFNAKSIGNFWWDALRMRLLNIADNSVHILKIMYLWIWAFLFFVFLLMPLVAQIILISLPIASWGIGRLRKTAATKTSNFKISIKGLYAKGSFMDNLSTTILFILYSLPSFWIGTLLIVFFTTKNYGELYDWFPTSGVQTLEIANNPNLSSFTKFSDIMYHMLLPIFCITYSSFSYLSRQMRGAMLGVMRQDYIRTANAKGLSEHKVTWKHAFRNSLFPIITLFSSVFPRALSGAIAIELIYNVPGMGVLVLSAINERDWPVVFTVAMLAAILTMIGNLIADVLYAVVDPRISFK